MQAKAIYSIRMESIEFDTFFLSFYFLLATNHLFQVFDGCPVPRFGQDNHRAIGGFLHSKCFGELKLVGKLGMIRQQLVVEILVIGCFVFPVGRGYSDKGPKVQGFSVIDICVLYGPVHVHHQLLVQDLDDFQWQINHTVLKIKTGRSFRLAAQDNLQLFFSVVGTFGQTQLFQLLDTVLVRGDAVAWYATLEEASKFLIP